MNVTANGKGWLTKSLVQVLLVVALIAYSAVLTIRETSTPKQPAYSTTQDAAVIDRLARIETKIDMMNERQDRFEKKLDGHIEKD